VRMPGGEAHLTRVIVAHIVDEAVARQRGAITGSHDRWAPKCAPAHAALCRTPVVQLASRQAALHGALLKIRDLGLPLVSVRRVQRKPRHECSPSPPQAWKLN
jgi:hypothetical protein